METVSLDSSALLAWRISNRIALRNSSKEIEPVHLYLAILSILDGIFWLEPWEVSPYKEAIEYVRDKKKTILEYLDLNQVELTKNRRKLEKQLDIGSEFDGDKSLHRSKSTIEIYRNSLDKVNKTGSKFVDIFDLLQEISQENVQSSIVKIKNQKLINERSIVQSASPKDLIENHESIFNASNRPKSPVLDQIGTDLTQLARENKLTPIIGRERQIKAIIQALHRTTKRNIILIGEAGVGKTAVVEGLAQLLSSEDSPTVLRRWRIVQINIADLIAGTHYRGVMEERLGELMKEVSSDPNLILFLDEIHLVVGAGKTEGGAMDVANILKPALARDDFHCIGATTSDEYERNIKKDPAFQRRFQVVNIPEPDEKATFAIGQEWMGRIETIQGVRFESSVLESAIELTNKYIRDRFQPDKIIDFLENAAAYEKVKYLFSSDENSSIEVPYVTQQSLIEVLDEHYGIQKEAEEMKLEETLEKALLHNLVGQDEAIKTVSETIISLSVLSNRRKDCVKGILLFMGPTGVGKSYTAQLIASHLYPENPKAFLRISMNEYKERYELSRLTGSSPGLIGHDNAGIFYLFAEKNPQGVILLDEFEKAHTEIQDFFLQIFDIGEARNNRGRLVNFRGHLFIITTNLFDSSTIEFKTQEAQRKILERHFKPEFLGRLDRIVIFNPLSTDDYLELFKRLLEDLSSDLHLRDIEFATNAVDKLNIVLSLSDQDEGARGFIREFEQKVYTPIIKLVSKSSNITKITLTCVGDQIILNSMKSN